MSGDYFRSVIKQAVVSIGLDPQRFSGHSLRSGGATDLFEARVAYHIIKKMGRWKSDAAMRYYRSDEDVVCSKSCQLSKELLPECLEKSIRLPRRWMGV
jgi:integrase